MLLGHDRPAELDDRIDRHSAEHRHARGGGMPQGVKNKMAAAPKSPASLQIKFVAKVAHF